MPRKIQLVPHFDVDTLEARYKGCQDPKEKSHWHMIWLLSRGKSTQEVADVLGLTVYWVRKIVRRYNRYGEAGLGDRRKSNGSKLLLNEDELVRLQQALQKEPPDGGEWSGPKVAAWIEHETGHKVGRQRGWSYWKRFSSLLHETHPPQQLRMSG